MFSITTTGSFQKTEAFLRRMSTGEIFKSLRGYGEIGRSALAAATPVDSGLAAGAWTVEVRNSGSIWELIWSNTDVESGFHVAIMLQYGHGTGTGGYVAGRDYINPAIRPVFDQISEAVWKEVTRA